MIVQSKLFNTVPFTARLWCIVEKSSHWRGQTARIFNSIRIFSLKFLPIAEPCLHDIAIETTFESVCIWSFSNESKEEFSTFLLLKKWKLCYSDQNWDQNRITLFTTQLDQKFHFQNLYTPFRLSLIVFLTYRRVVVRLRTSNNLFFLLFLGT